LRMLPKLFSEFKEVKVFLISVSENAGLNEQIPLKEA